MTHSFLNGAAWLRADLHLHTKADKEFKYEGEGNSFLKLYVAGLKAAGISIGLIANHNKFDRKQFCGLRKVAKEQDIFLIPGVELSVGDGANGVHLLIAFSEAWLKDKQIDSFLRSCFGTKEPAQYEQENGRSEQNLANTFKALEAYGHDYFLVFAHVEQKSGLWSELGGGRLQELAANGLFRKRVLGFQKVRTNDMRSKMKGHFGEAYPAEVEGCDCKSIQDLTESTSSRAVYLKVGAHSFEAVKHALRDHPNRLADAPQQHQRSYIKSVSFEGGALDGQAIHFSDELNTLIGIRGSGKSSILEAIRYALDIPYGDGATDLGYKVRLVEHMLGSGGRITVTALDRHGQQYEIRRIFGERPEVFSNKLLQPGVTILGTILHKPIYFGQKDLSGSGTGFEKNLIEKLVGQKLGDIRRQIDEKRQAVDEAITALMRIDAAADEIEEHEDKEKDAEVRLKWYKKRGIDVKMQKQAAFAAEEHRCQQAVNDVRLFEDSIGALKDSHEESLREQSSYKSKYNGGFFDEFHAIFKTALESFAKLEEAHTLAKSSRVSLEEKGVEFSGLHDGLKDEFASMERDLADHMRNEGGSFNLEDFKKAQTDRVKASRLLVPLRQRAGKRDGAAEALAVAQSELNALWHHEFQLIKAELDGINSTQDALQVKAKFKGDKDSAFHYLRDLFKGTGLRETKLRQLIDDYPDLGAIYSDLEAAKGTVGTKAAQFEHRFLENLSALLTWQVPNHFSIEYHGKDLKQHSIGQRASALILFILSQESHDQILIDQPEDDLDNQTIYKDLIQSVCRLKPKTQFIFVTHNPNFPVLGDAEQILACEFKEGVISVASGSIDDKDQQERVVRIMEGGKEALLKRQQRYESWTY